MMGTYEVLSQLNVNEHTETKDGLTYLTWSWAWDAVKKQYPEATYEIWKNENGLPYAYDPLTGFMVYTKVTIEGITHEMWLPVMDGKNKAMKAEPYDYTTRYGTKTVEAATMFDVNKTIMRCLVKNLAMFGLGLYIYAGEDLPEEEKKEAARISANEDIEYRTQLIKYIADVKMSTENVAKICKYYKVNKITELTGAQAKDYLDKAKESSNE